MRVTVLHFDQTGNLTRAFDRILESPDVESCMIEADHGRLRFLAPPDVADGLVQAIYLHGGLIWCSHHDFVKPEDAQG